MMPQDANTNLNSHIRCGQSCAWDAFNRLVTVGDGQNAIAHYLYDADGRRLKKNYGGGLSQSAETLYDGWRAIEEREGGSSNPARQFVFGIYLDEPLVMDVNGNANGSCIDFGATHRAPGFGRALPPAAERAGGDALQFDCGGVRTPAGAPGE